MATKEIDQINKKFVKSIKKVAKELKKEPFEVTTAQFRKNDESDLSEWELRKAGGFTNLKKMYFPKEENLEVKHGTRLVNSHRNKLEKSYGEALFVQREILKEFNEILKKSPIKLHPPKKRIKTKKSKKSRTLVAKVSDTHFGSNISRQELNNTNEYNWEIASRRLALFMEQVCNYKPDYRADTELVIQLNGDIIAGQIHNQEWFVDVLTDQFAGTLQLLGQAISYCAREFDKVTVVCTPGNHGRNVGKADRGRATTHKWDSYENMIYLALEQIMKTNSHVEFVIPQAPFALYKVQGHWTFQTHGDTVLNVGNPGKAISMSSIDAQINNINASELVPEGAKIAVACVGHVHVPTIQVLQSGCIAAINGCLSGVDPFAQSIGIFSNNPTQLMYEATEAHAVGDIRMIQVKGADKQARYDQIIEPYKRIMDRT